MKCTAATTIWFRRLPIDLWLELWAEPFRCRTGSPDNVEAEVGGVDAADGGREDRSREGATKARAVSRPDRGRSEKRIYFDINRVIETSSMF